MTDGSILSRQWQDSLAKSRLKFDVSTVARDVLRSDLSCRWNWPLRAWLNKLLCGDAVDDASLRGVTVNIGTRYEATRKGLIAKRSLARVSYRFITKLKCLSTTHLHTIADLLISCTSHCLIATRMAAHIELGRGNRACHVASRLNQFVPVCFVVS